jgi:hypothetical protein
MAEQNLRGRMLAYEVLNRVANKLDPTVKLHSSKKQGWTYQNSL